jgi:hypothetical protein
MCAVEAGDTAYEICQVDSSPCRFSASNAGSSGFRRSVLTETSSVDYRGNVEQNAEQR